MQKSCTSHQQTSRCTATLTRSTTQSKRPIMTDAELLEKLAEDIKEAAVQSSPSPQAMAVADQMIHRASAALADVHAHAMSRVDSMREQLNILENCITDARMQAEENTKRFMQLVTDGEESIRSMEKAVARIGDHLLK